MTARAVGDDPFAGPVEVPIEFGVMFFTDPTAAFRNLHQALAPGGRLVFVCWRAVDQNPWMQRPLASAARHLPLPPPPAPGAPGPFSLADPACVHGILADAGFVDVALEDVRETLTVGGSGSVEQAVDFLLQIGPVAAALREADPALHAIVAAAVRETIAPCHGPDGVRMASASWVVSARRT